MSNEPKKTSRPTLAILSSDISLRDIRNALWCPAYHLWIQRGGFDYRSHVRDLLLSCITRMAGDECRINSGMASLRMPCISQIDFPHTMGDVHNLLVDDLFDLLNEIRHTSTRIHASAYNALEASIGIARGLNFELMLLRGDITTLMYIDPFPPDNIWAMRSQELEFLSLMISCLRKLAADQFPENITLRAGIMNMSTMAFTPAVDDDERLITLLHAVETIAGGDASFEDKDSQRIQKIILKELCDGRNRTKTSRNK